MIIDGTVLLEGPVWLGLVFVHSELKRKRVNLYTILHEDRESE